METLAEYAGAPETVDPAARPLVLVAAATLSVADGEAVALLQPEPHPSASEPLWKLPRRAPARGESLEEAVRSELGRCGVTSAPHLEQLFTRETGSSEPDRLVEVAYLALVSSARVPSPALGCRWWPVSRLPTVVPGHTDLLEAAARRLRSLLWHTNAGWSLLPEEFTLSELQSLYEAAEGRSLDKRNFRKWVLGNDLVEATPRERRDGAHRPARLYRFRSKELVSLDRP